MIDILFLAHRSPYPPDRGDRIRGWHMLRHLARRARVHLVAFVDGDAENVVAPELAATAASVRVVTRRKSRARAAVEALATGRPVSLTAFDDPAMQAAVADVLAAHPIATVHVFSGQMAQYAPVAGPPLVMDFADVDSAKFAALAGQGSWPMRRLMRREARLLGAFERQVAARAAASLLVSEAEAALFREGGATGRIVAVENGIDTHRFDPALDHAPTPATAAPLIVFTGQMDYRPNIDAVTAFARDALPAIRHRHPQACFAIVGRAPTPAVRVLANDPAVLVTGEVPDVRPWLAAADVCVAPLRLARGIQNKVLEAMAMARPVVASPEAAEGIDHAGTIRIADDAASAVCDLLDDPAGAAALGQAARARVVRRYGWDARLAPLDALHGLDPAMAA